MNNIYTELALDNENPILNYKIAALYQDMGHYASASSHFLRAAERAEESKLAYESLIRCYQCFYSMSRRDFSTLHFLTHAITVEPKRPEAYFLLARYRRLRGEWYDGYTTACIGIGVCNFDDEILESVDYRGRYNLLLEKAIAGWHWEKCDETESILTSLKDDTSIDNESRSLVLKYLNEYLQK